MITQEQFTRLSAVLPVLQNAESKLISEFRQNSFYTRIPIGKDVFVVGDHVNAIALLISGLVRVYRVGETGREITLYRFGTGESCILTANAILNDQPFSAIATVEEDAEAIMVPAALFRDWVKRYPLWLDFVLTLLSQRLFAVMEIVDEVAFRRLDIRVAEVLLAKSQKQNPIIITHQEIAAELGSSREVISRILETFTRQNVIRVERGAIEIINLSALSVFAAR